MKKLIKLGMVSLAGVLALAGCSGGESSTEKSESTAADTSWQDVEDAGVLKIGLCPEYPPFESVDNKGDIVGFDPSLANKMAAEMGVEVEFINTPWEGLIAGLNNDDYDLVMSAMSPEEATAATDQVNLSEPYYELTEIIVVAKDNAAIKNKEDLAGKTVGSQTGSSSEQAVAALADAGIKIDKANAYNRTQDAIADLKNGAIDAVVVSYPYAVTQAKSDDSLKIINDPVHSANLVAVANKGADALTEKFNTALQTTIDNGGYAEVEKEWLSLD